MVKEYNFMDQFAPGQFKAAMDNCNKAEKLRFNHGDENTERVETNTTGTPDAPKRKRGRPRKDAKITQ